MPDYIRPADVAFDTWTANFAAFGLTAGDIAAVRAAHSAWTAARKRITCCARPRRNASKGSWSETGSAAVEA